MEITVKIPIKVEMGVRKKKNVYLNLNVYRNMPHHQSNTLKIKYKEEISKILPDFYFKNFSLHYKIFLPNKMKRDIMNVGAIVDKFFCDCLVELGRVPDDNYDYLQDISFSFGGYDDDKEGYVEATVKEK
jgi:hypothetical protein